MRKISVLIALLALSSYKCSCQQTEPTSQKAHFFLETAQGVPFLIRGAGLSSKHKPYDASLGYLSRYSMGIHKLSKTGKGFSQYFISLRSSVNVLKNIKDTRPVKVGNIEATDRSQFISLGYQYSKYVNKIKNQNAFLGLGIEFSYILNRKVTTKFSDGSETLEEKATTKEIASNIVLPSSPTLMLTYGVDIDKPLMNIGEKCQLGLTLSYDYFFFGLSPSPAHQNLGAMLNYRLMF